MNIFWHDLKSYRKMTVEWTIALATLAVLFLGLFPSFTNDIEASKEVLKNLPIALRDILGISLNNFFTIFGFFAYLFNFVVVAGAVQAMNLGVGIIAKESTGKTADFLLSKPVSRASVITQKLLAATILLVITSAVFSIVSLAAALAFSPDSFDVLKLLLIAGSLLLIQLIFMALGVCIAVAMPRIKSVIAVTLPTVFSFYVIGSVGSVVDSETTRYLAPFKYFDPMYVVFNGTYELKFLAVWAGVVLVAIVLSYLLFNRKDINSGV